MKNKKLFITSSVCLAVWLLWFFIANGGIGGLIILRSYISILTFLFLLTGGILLSKSKAVSVRKIVLYYIFAGIMHYLLFFLFEWLIGLKWPVTPADPQIREIYYKWTTVKYSFAESAKRVLPWLFIFLNTVFRRKITCLHMTLGISASAIVSRLIFRLFGSLSLFSTAVTYLNLEWIPYSIGLFMALLSANFFHWCKLYDKRSTQKNEY